MQKNCEIYDKSARTNCDIGNEIEIDDKDIILLIKRCLKWNIHVTDNAYEHHGEERKCVIRKYENIQRSTGSLC